MSVAQSREPRPALDGKFALLREIGRGTRGIVYEAEQLLVGKLVAVKLLNRAAFATSDWRERFLSEARASARIAHENIVDVQGFGVTPEGEPYLVMELLRGEPLSRVIEARGSLSTADACEVMQQILAALSAAHAQGVLHGALTPDNVMLSDTRSGQMQVKLLDFGAGRDAALDAERAAYASPEQTRGAAIDTRSDIYSASALLYTMLAGRAPCEGHDAEAVRALVLGSDFEPLCQVNPLVPKLLAAIVERGLALEPRRRIESAEEYSELLYPFLGGGIAALSLPSAQPKLSDPVPRIAAPREVTISESSSERPPRESSVVPIRIASYARGVTDSLLVAPRFPRSASTPRLRVGKDFMPAPGAPGWAEVVERRQSTRAPLVQPRAARNAWPAIVATAIGFTLGVIIAWLTGAI